MVQPIMDWCRSELAALHAQPPQRRGGLLLGGLCYGKEFIDRFARYCMASIVAPENLAALKERSLILLYTDAAHRTRLLETLRPLVPAGLDIMVRDVPDELLELLPRHGAMRYLLLGAVQNLTLQTAARLGMGYHMLMPDHIHAERYFARLMKLAETHDAVIQTGISASWAGAAEPLEQHRRPDGEIVIDDRTLCTIGWKHLHRQMQVYVMNHARIPDHMPMSHYMLWQARDRLAIYCPHLNPAYLSAQLCQIAPIWGGQDVFGTLDTRLPALLGGATVYIPGVDDGLGFIEVSDDSKAVRPGYTDRLTWAAICWRNVGFMENHMPLFRQVCELPIEEQPDGLDRETIEAQHAQVVNALYEARAEASIALHQMMYTGKEPFPQATRIE